MAKDWKDRWGEDVSYKHGGSHWKVRNFEETNNPKHIADSNKNGVAIRITPSLVIKLKTASLLGLKRLSINGIAPTRIDSLRDIPYPAVMLPGIDTVMVAYMGRGKWIFKLS